MSITYEEAMETLTSMFGDKWSLENLDFVLRKQQGHMENTVDLILRHDDEDPSVLVEQLKAGMDPDASTREIDEHLARQLAQQERQRQVVAVAASNTNAATTTTPHGHRGTLTTLPDDFLRIPHNANPSLVDDEALARMLQDELFTEELARNPDFAHLARRPRTSGGLPVGSDHTRRSTNNNRMGPPQQSPNNVIMDKISELGDNARRRLQLLAAQFQNAHQAPNDARASSSSSNAASERRGLLDDTDDMELAARKDL